MEKSVNGVCQLLTGQELASYKYEYVGDFNDGLMKVYLNGKWGYTDINGKEVVPCKYDWVCDFQDELALVSLNGQWGFVDKTTETQGHIALILLICYDKYEFKY